MKTSQNIISDEIYFQDTLEKIKQDWFDKLHILADFDRTLTKAFYNWKLRSSLISVLRSEWYLSEEYAKSAYELFDYYNPIEVNPNIALEEKKKEMTIWWNKHLDLLVKSGLHRKDIEKIIESEIIELRPWVIKFIEFLNENNIPMVIISANWLWTDSIEMFFEKNWLMSDNIKIISNSLFWDKEWNAIWYDERVIHVFNKDETVLHEYPEIFNLIKHRTNVILLWDSTWDPAMIEWFNYTNLLKFGFLNEKPEELIGNYSKIFDVVMTWDSDWEFLGEVFE